MASLDDLEGDTVEAVVVVLLVILAVFVFLALRYGSTLAQAFAQGLSNLLNFIKNIFSPAQTGATGANVLHAGSNLDSGAPFDVSTYQAGLDNQLAAGTIDLTDYESATAWAKTQGG